MSSPVIVPVRCLRAVKKVESSRDLEPARWPVAVSGCAEMRRACSARGRRANMQQMDAR